MRFKTYYLTERVVVKNEQLIKEIKKRYLTDIKDIEKQFTIFKHSDDLKYYDEKKKLKLRQYLTAISKKYEKYMYDVVLSNHMKRVSQGASKDKLSYYGNKLQSSAWTFIMFISSIDYYLENPKKTSDYNNYEKYKPKIFAKAKPIGRDMVKDAIDYVNSLKDEEKKQDFAEPTRYKNAYFVSVGGITEEQMEGIVNSYKKLYNLLKNKKLNKGLNDTFRVKIIKQSDHLIGGHYDYKKDEIVIRELGIDMGTIIHEYAHRYWFKYMKDDQRALWVNVFTNNIFTITTKDIDDLISYLKANKNEYDYGIGSHIKRILPEYERARNTDPLIKNKVKYYNRDLTNGIGDIFNPKDEEKLRRIANVYLVDKPLLKDKITDYGNTNYREAFAETFRLYVENGTIPKNMKEYFLKAVGLK